MSFIICLSCCMCAPLNACSTLPQCHAPPVIDGLVTSRAMLARSLSSSSAARMTTTRLLTFRDPFFGLKVRVIVVCGIVAVLEGARGPSCSAALASHSHLLGLKGDMVEVRDGKSECCKDKDRRDASEGRIG